MPDVCSRRAGAVRKREGERAQKAGHLTILRDGRKARRPVLAQDLVQPVDDCSGVEIGQRAAESTLIPQARAYRVFRNAPTYQ